MNKVLLVNGSGRSGASVVAGALTRLGLHRPEPHDQAGGSRWVSELHQAILRRSPVVRVFDSRPESAELARSLTTEEDVAALDGLLVAAMAHARRGQVVIEDPRSLWFRDLWHAAATGRDAELAFVTMVRHPIEVAMGWASDAAEERADNERLRRQQDTAHVAAWVQTSFVIEESTRDDPRVVVRLHDVLGGWRPVLTGVAERLGLELDLDAGAPLVDAAMPSADALPPRPGWDTLDVPDALRAVAEGTWEQLDRLADDPRDESAVAALGRLRSDYERVFDHALGLATDHTVTREVHVRRRAQAAMRKDHESQIAQLEQQLEEALSAGDEEDR